MCRWSFCNSDDDDEREAELNQMDAAKDTNQVVKDNKDLVLEEEDEVGEEEDGDWEYYYEDAELKPNEEVMFKYFRHWVDSFVDIYS